MSRPPIKGGGLAKDGRVQMLLRKTIPREAALLEIWQADISSALRQDIFRTALAIGIAELIRTGRLPLSLDNPERSLDQLGGLPVDIPPTAAPTHYVPSAQPAPRPSPSPKPEQRKRALSGIM